jgi:hypothetical protein
LGVAAFGAVATIGYVAQGFSIVDQAELGQLSSVEADAYDRSGQSIAGFTVIVLIATAVAFLAWLSRSVENAPPLGGGIPKDSPRASIGWWFVPIISLFKPYQIVADLYRRMVASGPAQAVSVTIIVVWWVCFIGQGLIARLADLTPLTTLESIRTSLSILLVSAVGDLAAAILAIMVVRRIQLGADRRAGELGLAPRVVGPTWPSQAASASSGAIGPTARTEVQTDGRSVSAAGDGTSVPVTSCPTCGARRLAGASFCGSCGQDLGAPTAQVS